MIDTLFIVLESLKLLVDMMSRIFSLIFLNYFPTTPPDDSGKDGFKDLNI
jgi:hypothetical protein